MPVLAETVDKVEEDQRHVGEIASVNHICSKYYFELADAGVLLTYVVLEGIHGFEANEVP